MTTIAYKDGVLACDSQVSEGNLGYQEFNKIIKINEDIIIAVAGCVEDIKVFLNWFSRGAKEEDNPSKTYSDLDFVAIVVTPNGVFEYYSKCVPLELKSKYRAVGSGKAFALGAMAMGASAIEAINVAKKFDVYTGGRVRSFSIGKKKRVQKKR